MTLTRRGLLAEFGLLSRGGLSLAALQMLGVSSPASAAAARFALPAGSGKGRKVVILGAGIAGLVSAYELRRAGYDVTVLEARKRIGGRVWTVRGGDLVQHMERPDQRAAFSPGLYLNAGAARIPSSHEAILGYARRFGIALEPYVNTNRSTGWDFAGKVHREGQMVFDFRSRLAEIVAEAVKRGQLDGELTPQERDGFRQFLQFYGSLNQDYRAEQDLYGSWDRWPGAYGETGSPSKTLTLKEIFAAPQAIGLPLVFEAISDMQATMMQPVGGMDRIARSIYAEVEPVVKLGTPVTAIRREGAGVRIEHAGGMTRADFCVACLPAMQLERIPNDFSPAKKAALKGIHYLPSAKVGFEAPRFWEEEGVYGGNAWTDRLNENVMYPSAGFNSPRGVLVGAYVAGWTHQDTPRAFVSLPFAEQERIARESVEALHPGKSRLLEKPLVVNWGRVRWSEGVGAVGDDFGPEKRGGRYDELLKPEGPIVFAGEHLSYVGLWQEGAALSAHEAIKLVHAMATGASRSG